MIKPLNLSPRKGRSAGPPAIEQGGPAAVPDVATVKAALAVFTARKSRSTGELYTRDLARFARMVGAGSPADAIRELIEAGQDGANERAAEYVAADRRAGSAVSSCKRRLSAVRGALAECRRVGIETPTIAVAPGGRARPEDHAEDQRAGRAEADGAGFRAALDGGLPIGPAEMLETFLARRSENTRRNYVESLRAFARWLDLPDITAAVRLLLTCGGPRANLAAMNWAAALRAQGKAPATINGRMAALRSILKFARLVGLCGYAIEIDRERAEVYRDTAGPPIERVRQILDTLADRAAGGNAKAARDLAVVSLLFFSGLRISECLNIDLPDDIDLPPFADGRIRILGKARGNKEWLTLTDRASDALVAWLDTRGREPGPVFVSVTGNGGLRIKRPLRRVQRESINRSLAEFGTHPHALRHSAVTTVLSVTNGNIAAAQKFSRHVAVQVLMVYNDARLDVGGNVAKLLDRAIERPVVGSGDGPDEPDEQERT